MQRLNRKQMSDQTLWRKTNPSMYCNGCQLAKAEVLIFLYVEYSLNANLILASY